MEDPGGSSRNPGKTRAKTISAVGARAKGIVRQEAGPDTDSKDGKKLSDQAYNDRWVFRKIGRARRLAHETTRGIDQDCNTCRQRNAPLRYDSAKKAALESIMQLAKDIGVDDSTNRKEDVTQDASDMSPMTEIALGDRSHLSSAPAKGSLAVTDEAKDRGTTNFKILAGRLLPAPMSGFHYVGPASSICLAFAIAVRQLVGQTDLIRMTISDGDLFERIIKAAELTAFSVSQALEARIAGHLFSNAVNDEDTISAAVDFEVPSYVPATGALPGGGRTYVQYIVTPRSMLRNGRWRALLPSREITN
ncbi:hypothetical protein IAU59_007198 [Kwoniella sp. CBS 9459]